MKIKNKRGPNTDPYGTSGFIILQSGINTSLCVQL